MQVQHLLCLGIQTFYEQASLVWIPHKVTCSSMGSSHHRSLPGPCSSSGFPGVHRLLSGIPLLQCGLLQELQVDLCTHMNLHGLQGHSCFTMLCTTGCRGTSPQCLEHVLPSSNDLTVFFLSHILIPLVSECNYLCALNFYSFLNMSSERCYCHH